MKSSLYRVLLAIGCLSAGLASVMAHDPPEASRSDATNKAPVKFADLLAHKPTPEPDRIILTVTNLPATSLAVTWRTDTSVETAQAQIALADGGPKFRLKPETVLAKTVDLVTNLGPCHMHAVQFQGLQPKTKYAYRVGDGVNWSEWFQTTTAATEPEPFTFIYFGDAQNEVKSMWSRVVREAFKDAPQAALMIHAGDLINVAENDAEWGEWHRAGGWLNGMLPSLPTPGNHEYAKDPDQPMKRKLSKHWRAQFTLPENGPAGLLETVYYVDYQGVRFISLNSNEGIEVQTEWLQEVLGKNTQKWTVITFHHPIYSTAKKRDNPTIRAAWQPIFDRFRVDLVLNGHDHTYGRTALETFRNEADGQVAQSPEGGTMYVVSVSGPKMYDFNPMQTKMKRVAEDTQLYQIIRVDGDQLKYEARTAIGERYDAFTLKKRAGKVNELIDEMPNTPARLRLPPVTPAAPQSSTKEPALPVVKP